MCSFRVARCKIVRTPRKGKSPDVERECIAANLKADARVSQYSRFPFSEIASTREGRDPRSLDFLQPSMMRAKCGKIHYTHKRINKYNTLRGEV